MSAAQGFQNILNSTTVPTTPAQDFRGLFLAEQSCDSTLYVSDRLGA